MGKSKANDFMYRLGKLSPRFAKIMEATELETREGVREGVIVGGGTTSEDATREIASVLVAGHTDAGKRARRSPTESGRSFSIHSAPFAPFRSVAHRSDTVCVKCKTQHRHAWMEHSAWRCVAGQAGGSMPRRLALARANMFNTCSQPPDITFSFTFSFGLPHRRSSWLNRANPGGERTHRCWCTCPRIKWWCG
jgi:hypothetical protein